MTPRAITERLKVAAKLADLRTDRRLHAKLDMSPEGITRRLRQAAALHTACAKLSRLRATE